MGAAGIHSVELLFLLLLVFVAALAAMAKRFQVPYPIVLVVGGLILSLFPRGPHIELNPNIVFLIVLPPLVFSAAFVTSWQMFRQNFVSIMMLAFGLVGFTVFGIAAASRWILPGFDWRMGLVLGAVVSTTDAIAATSIAKRVGLPKPVTDILEAESLVNDASGLLALEFTTALLVTGRSPGILGGAADLAYLVAGSTVIGLAIGKAIDFFETKINDAPIEITMTLAAPFLAYLAAESARASGVLATVVCGLYLGQKSSLYFSRAARLTGRAVWDTLTFILNGFVFILIGFQLPYILEGIRTLSIGRLLALGMLFSVVVILLRIVWVFPGAWISNFIRSRFLRQPMALPDRRQVFIVGWTGMRGVVALAAAISLPVALGDGSAFPQRNVMIFLAFCVIFVTLVLQGLTLPGLIRALGLCGAPAKDPEEAPARRAIIEAAVAFLEDRRDDDDGQFAVVYDDLLRFQRRRLNTIESNNSAEIGYRPEDYARWRELSREIRALQRASLLNLRNHNEISDEVMRKLEHEIDLMDAGFSSADKI
ncbi:MAG TPA: Na+/H+ antiporter [Candidatus Acidoferrales bacterium]|jgi:CPA1 family monovalent cation:H+ antiporter|nr:Na+/H+ antiporter [Candidatus Acidoferrales bacterium]